MVPKEPLIITLLLRAHDPQLNFPFINKRQSNPLFSAVLGNRIYTSTDNYGDEIRHIEWDNVRQKTLPKQYLLLFIHPTQFALNYCTSLLITIVAFCWHETVHHCRLKTSLLILQIIVFGYLPFSLNMTTNFISIDHQPSSTDCTKLQSSMRIDLIGIIWHWPEYCLN